MTSRKKRKKLSIKKLSIFLFTVILFISLLVFRVKIIYFIESKITGYSFNTINLAHKYNIYKDVKKHKYSDTLENIINSDDYKNEYVSYYLDTTYQNKDNFFTSINSLFSLGYNSSDVNTIYDTLNDDDIKLLIDSEYYKDIANILKLNYFDSNNLERYLEYGNKNNDSASNIVTYVNIGLDKDYYTDIVNIDNSDDIFVLVNKYHKLDNNYVPNDLEVINSKYNKGTNNKLRHVARENFEKMCEDALKDNIKIYSGSAYRSYSYQLSLYNRYVSKDGKINADKYAARAGHSEHQTGLATDIMNSKYEYISSNDIEYDWLINNSYKYGFILRYPKDKENITGYMYEEWHFRYIGDKVAKIIHDKNLTFDEYIARGKNS